MAAWADASADDAATRAASAMASIALHRSSTADWVAFMRSSVACMADWTAAASAAAALAAAAEAPAAATEGVISSAVEVAAVGGGGNADLSATTACG